MTRFLSNFSCFFAIVCASVSGMAAQAPNPRSSNVVPTSPRSESKIVLKRGTGNNSKVISDTSRVAARNGSTVVSRGLVNGPAQSVRVKSRTASGGGLVKRMADNRSRAASSTVVRSLLPYNSVRRGENVASGLARAATKSRATAVFSDVSKIGGGYAQCRDAYATCMDQFCANANDTYRRCYCSAKFTELRDTEVALDEAKTLLQRFEDSNLNAVDKTAAEVNAMYTATVGEAAIKNDVSGAQSILNEIGDLLSGKKKVEKNSEEELGLISMDFVADMDDIWGSAGDRKSIFDTDTGTDITALEGQNLYNVSNKNCLEVVAESCQGDAVINMASSAYNIMITQDCNLYERNVEKQRESVKQTVRQAEKFLREARLEEYRAHNSADVNECIVKVKTAILAEPVCGENYVRCLDYTGIYINSTDGQPIYSPRLFKMNELITLDGGSDIMKQNKEFDAFLDSKREFAASALDTCRDKADFVWEEFKRSALIEISQAQDAKIEEVKMSCVSTMAECYDTQSKALKKMDTNTEVLSGAIAASAARSMCADKVMACASLYGNTQNCKFDGNGVLTTGNNTSGDAMARCGLTALLDFVDVVDEGRILEGCETAVRTQLTKLCTPTSGDKVYPYGCRSMTREGLKEELEKYKSRYCSVEDVRGEDGLKISDKINEMIADLDEEMEEMFDEECAALGGYWIYANDEGKLFTIEGKTDFPLLNEFYNELFAGQQPSKQGNGEWSDDFGGIYGVCLENTTMVRCEMYNDAEFATKDGKKYANYNVQKDECEFTDEWYKRQCTVMGGVYENGVCYTQPNKT